MGLILLAWTCALALAACGGEDGAAGPPAPDGGEGQSEVVVADPSLGEPTDGSPDVGLPAFAFAAERGIYVGWTDLRDPVPIIEGSADFSLGSWSPDGTQLAFTSNRGGRAFPHLYTIGFDGTGLRKLTDESKHYGGPQWSPDGSQIAFTVMSGLQDWATGGVRSRLHLMGPGGGDARQLTHAETLDMWPQWSPDGTRIAFVRAQGKSGESSWTAGVYLMQTDAGTERALTEGTGVYGPPHWSPDGTRLVYDLAEGDMHDICVINADGGSPMELVTGMAGDSDPRWSPDGTRIAFSSVEGDARAIYTMRADGSDPVRVTEGLWSDSHPSWSPDGSLIAFVSDRDGVPAIYLTSPDGAYLANIANGDPRLGTSHRGVLWAPGHSRQP